MSSSISTPLTFTGVSTFSNDFQTILQRAVSIANLPVQQLQSKQSLLLTQKQLLADLNGSVSSLASTISSLADLGSSKAITATSSDPSTVSVTANGTTQAATHTISEITSIAKAASETSASGFATATSTSVTSGSSFELAIGSKTYNVPIASNNNNLNALRDAINNLGVGVTASVLNTGSGATPYYLSLSANATGQNALQLRTTAGDAATNILTATNPGSNATFKLDGILVTNPDNVVSSVIDGVTFNILNTTASGGTVTLSSSSDRTKLENALNTLVSDYNTVSGKANAQIGKAAGALSGDSVIRQVKDAQRQFLSYQGDPSSSVKSLAELGISLDSNGNMSFDPSKIESYSSADLSQAFTFLGSSSSGLGSLASNFTAISDSVSGSIVTEEKQIDAADSRMSQQVADLNARISFMQTSLTAQLQKADALVAGLTSQQSMLTGSIQSLNLVMYGKQTTSY